MSFFKNLISSALGTFIALGLLFVFMLVFLAGSVALMDEETDAVELKENTVLVRELAFKTSRQWAGFQTYTPFEKP